MWTTDDRGQRIRLERLHRSLLRPPDETPLKFSPAQLERERVGGQRTALTLLSVLAFFVLAVVAASMTFPVPCAGHLAGFAVLIGIVWYASRRVDRIGSLHYLPMHSICPACGHSIRGVPAEQDGCTVCPECGAAWRLPARANESIR